MVLTLCLLRSGTSARRCAAGHHSSRARASATSGSGIPLARTWDVEAWGYMGSPSQLDGGARAAL
jgi:hypothetical protein